MSVITPIDSPQSVHNRCVIEVSWASVLSLDFFLFSDCVGFFVIGLIKISSLLSLFLYCVIEFTLILCVINYMLVKILRMVLLVYIYNFLRWTQLIFFSIQFPITTVNKKFGIVAESHAHWLIHQMKLSACCCGNFEFITFLREF